AQERLVDMRPAMAEKTAGRLHEAQFLGTAEIEIQAMDRLARVEMLVNASMLFQIVIFVADIDDRRSVHWEPLELEIGMAIRAAKAASAGIPTVRLVDQRDPRCEVPRDGGIGHQFSVNAMCHQNCA